MIHTTVDGDVRVVTLDRPERRNALTWDALEDLRECLAEASEPVVYLQGAGDAFCAGADLDTVSSLSPSEAEAFSRAGQETADALATYDGATVAGIDGPARGGGVELALGCDLRIATPDATLAETGVRIGLFGAWGGTARLPEIAGHGEAMDIALSGRPLDASEARRMGLVSRIVEDPRQVADEIADNDPTALRTIKARIRDDADPETLESRETTAFADLIAAFDHDRNG